MSFKLNDYNSFLTSLYEKDKTIERDKLLDFDFGLGLNEDKQEPGQASQAPPEQPTNFNTNIARNSGAPPFTGYTGSMSSSNFNSSLGGYSDPSFNEQPMASNLFNNYDSTINNTPDIFGSGDNTSTGDFVERPIKKKSHNVIEQRYRNKINDKFTALQNSVPSLRIVSKRNTLSKVTSNEGSDEEEEEQQDVLDPDVNLEGLEPARKLNKGTILAKSIEYIKFLELKNNRMKMEYNKLMETAKMLGIDVQNINL